MILDQIANFITDLIQFDPTKVIIAGTNYVNVNFDDNLILIDMLTSNPIGRSSKYNSVTEVMEYQAQMKGVITFSFYGALCFDNAVAFIAMMESEEAINSAYINNISYRFPSRIQNVGRLIGSGQHDMYEIEMVINYVYTSARSVLSIATDQVTFLANK